MGATRGFVNGPGHQSHPKGQLLLEERDLILKKMLVSELNLRFSQMRGSGDQHRLNQAASRLEHGASFSPCPDKGYPRRMISLGKPKSADQFHN